MTTDAYHLDPKYAGEPCEDCGRPTALDTPLQAGLAAIAAQGDAEEVVALRAKVVELEREDAGVAAAQRDELAQRCEKLEKELALADEKIAQLKGAASRGCELAHKGWKELPEDVRTFIYELETNCDPSSQVRDTLAAKQNVKFLETALAAARACPVCGGGVAPPVSGKPCACGGDGKMQTAWANTALELHNARERIVELENDREEMLQIVRRSTDIETRLRDSDCGTDTN